MIMLLILKPFSKTTKYSQSAKKQLIEKKQSGNILACLLGESLVSIEVQPTKTKSKNKDLSHHG